MNQRRLEGHESVIKKEKKFPSLSSIPYDGKMADTVKTPSVIPKKVDVPIKKGQGS